jgi:hypothetical protein
MDLTPTENQLTATLGWLLDHSQVFSRALARLFVEHDAEAIEAVGAAETLGAQLQLPLRASTGWRRPDLSIDGSDRAFQLLIEVKLGSQFQEYAVPELGRSLSQPDAYLHAWDQCAPLREARVRRVGTLTLDGQAPRDESYLSRRAADVTWAQVHALLQTLLDEKQIDEDVILVSSDLRDYLAKRVLPVQINPELLEWASKLTKEVVARLVVAIPGASSHGSFRPKAKFLYAGGDVHFRSPKGAQKSLRLIVAQAGSKYHAPGRPEGLQIVDWFGPEGPEAAELFATAGFQRLPDVGRSRLYRASLPITEIRMVQGLDEQVAVAFEWAWARLSEAGLTPICTETQRNADGLTAVSTLAEATDRASANQPATHGKRRRLLGPFGHSGLARQRRVGTRRV